MTADPLRVLIVCTANVCRSPVAERLLQRRLRDANIPAQVSSAGTHVTAARVHRYTLAAARSRGVDLGDHRPRVLTTEIIKGAGRDLIIAMAREHMYEVVALDSSAFTRTYTLVELARRIDGTGLAGLRTSGQSRTTADLLPGDPADDIADPYGLSKRAHTAMVEQVDELVAEVVRKLAT
jgi:protein-tyrosine phosphatase